MKYIVYILIVMTIIMNINNVSAETITKSGISLELIENSDYCDTNCYSVYKVCNVNQLIINSLNFKFINDKKINREISKDINIIQNDSCYRIRIDGQKNIFESIDNIPCFNDLCFNEFAWWNSNYIYKQAINVSTTNNLIDYQISLNFNSTYKPNYWSWENACEGRLIITNKTDDGELPFWVQICSVINDNAIIWIKGNWTNENGTQAYLYYGYGNGEDKSNPENTMYVYDDFGVNSSLNYTKASTTPNSVFTIIGGSMFIDTSDSDTWFTLYNNQKNITDLCLQAKYKHSGGGNQWVTLSIRTSPDRKYRYFRGIQLQLDYDYLIKWVNQAETILDADIGQTWVAYNSYYWSEICAYNEHLKTDSWNINKTALHNSNYSIIDYGVNGTFGNYFGFSTQKGDMTINTYFVRNFIYPEPIIELGLFESYFPLVPNITILNVSVVYQFTMDNAFYIGTCLNNNTLQKTWNKTSYVNGGLVKGYEKEIIPCPYGCIEQLNEHGDGCSYPTWELFTIIIIIIIIVVILSIYLSKK